VLYQIKPYSYDVRDNHTGGSAEISSAVVGGPDPNNVRRGTATIKQRVARSSEVRKTLGISHGTLQNLRIKNILPHRTVGGLMYYKYQDILRLLEGGGTSKPDGHGKA
ncbi:MAG: helix-turn-helix domain-containing protein, partial [Chryseosolibacter sp.]